MPVAVTCPNPACARTSRAPDAAVGKTLKCPGCGQPFVANPSSATAIRPSTADGAAETARPRTATVATPVERVGRFVVKGKLGEGAFGAVYRAFDPQLDREVALKVPHAAVLDSPKRVERFLREAKAAANLRHPHIVPVFDAGTDGGRNYIASAFIDGQKLADAVEQADGGLEFERAARLVRELAEALAYAHGQGVVHRDVKPDNVMLDGQDRVHLMDFGLAARQDAESKLTNDGAVMGTPSYMAPEQAKGDTAAVGPAADQYACGVVLYELMTGQTPFSGPVPVVIHNQIHTDPDPPSKLRRAIPKDLETVCLKAMSKRPGDRYPTCQALADDLRRWLEGEPVSARRLGIVEKAVRWVRKNPAAAGLLAAGVVLVGTAAVAVGFAVLAAQAVQGRADAEVAKGEAVTARDQLAEQKREVETARDGEEEQRKAAEAQRDAAEKAQREAEAAQKELAKAQERLARSQYSHTLLLAGQEWRENNIPGALELLGSAQADLRGWEWRYMSRLCATGASVVMNCPSSGGGVSWSPNGKHLLICQGRPEIRDARTGSQGPILAPQGNPTLFAEESAWSPDSSRVLTVSNDGRARVWDPVAGKELTVFQLCPEKPVPKSVSWVACVSPASWSSDGTRVVIPCGDSTARIWDATTGAELAVLKGHTKLVRAGAFSGDGAHVVTISQDGTARVWDAKRGAELSAFKGHNGDVTGCQWSPDGTRIVTASSFRDSCARVWEAKTGAEITTIKNSMQTHCRPMWSPDGSRIVCESGKNVSVWDAKTGAELVTLKGHTDIVPLTAWSPDGRRIVTASKDLTARVWDAKTGTELDVLKGHTQTVSTAAFSPDGSRVVTAAGDGTTRVWNFKAESTKTNLRGYAGYHGSNPWSPDGTRIVGRGGGNTACVWDAKTGATLATLKGHAHPVHALEWSPDGNSVVTSSVNGTVCVLDAKTGAEVAVLKEQKGIEPVLSWSPDGTRIASTAREDLAVRVWDAKTGAQQFALSGKGVTPYAPPVWSLDGTRIVTFGTGPVQVWDARTGAELRTSGEDRSWGVLFSPEGGRVLSTRSGSVVVLDDSTTTELATFKGGPKNMILELSAWHPGGTKIATTGRGSKTAWVWDAKTGAEFAVLKGHTSELVSIQWSPDGSRVLTSSAAEPIAPVRLWDAESGLEVANFRGLSVTGAYWSPDGTRVCAVGRDDAVVWDAGPAK